MTPGERIALDALEEVGVQGVNLFHLHCLAAFIRSVRMLGWPKVTEYGTQRAHSETRYKNDLSAMDLDTLHVRAEWDHAEWMAERAGRRVVLRVVEPLPFQEALT